MRILTTGCYTDIRRNNAQYNNKVDIVATVETEASNGENKTLLATPHPAHRHPSAARSSRAHASRTSRWWGGRKVERSNVGGSVLCRDQTAERPLEKIKSQETVTATRRDNRRETLSSASTLKVKSFVPSAEQVRQGGEVDQPQCFATGR